MLGGMAAKWRWRKRAGGRGKPTDRPNMVCGPVQVVWHKFARYWDVEIREIPMAPGRYGMDVEQMLERVDENTIMVVPTFGVTYTGSYEPVLELSNALDKLQEERASTSTCTSTGPAAPSSPRSVPRTSPGTSGSRGSSRSAALDTSSASPHSAWAGFCGATRPTSQRSSFST